MRAATLGAIGILCAGCETGHLTQVSPAPGSGTPPSVAQLRAVLENRGLDDPTYEALLAALEKAPAAVAISSAEHELTPEAAAVFWTIVTSSPDSAGLVRAAAQLSEMQVSGGDAQARLKP